MHTTHFSVSVLHSLNSLVRCSYNKFMNDTVGKSMVESWLKVTPASNSFPKTKDLSMPAALHSKSVLWVLRGGNGDVGIRRLFQCTGNLVLHTSQCPSHKKVILFTQKKNEREHREVRGTLKCVFFGGAALIFFLFVSFFYVLFRFLHSPWRWF